MESATSGVLLPASFARPLSVFWVCEGSIPNPPNILLFGRVLAGLNLAMDSF
jgi:hypothetical protein